MTGAMDAVVDCILGILDWINNNVGSEEFHHVNIEKQVNVCLRNLHKKGFTRTDLGEFRLMITVQICCLAKVVVKGHKDLHNLVYPVAKLGAAQLSHVLAHERPQVLDIIVRENGLEDYRYNGAEGSLCETSEARIGNIMDYVFHGQLQLQIGKEGKNLLKRYNSNAWERF